MLLGFVDIGSSMDQRDNSTSGALGIALRLLVISLIVGVVLSALGVNAANLVQSFTILAQRIYGLGFGAIDWIVQYILVGAIVVVPIWLIAALVGNLRNSKAQK
jgi:hypothetical protein